MLELPLAGFFLKKLLHKSCDLNDLPSLDAELYKQLLFLRDYDGDVEDLALTFTATDSALGQNTEVRLQACEALRCHALAAQWHQWCCHYLCCSFCMAGVLARQPSAKGIDPSK